MESPPVIRIGASRPEPDYAEKFHMWLTQAYNPMLMRCKEVRAIDRYQIVKETSEYVRNTLSRNWTAWMPTRASSIPRRPLTT